MMNFRSNSLTYERIMAKKKKKLGEATLFKIYIKTLQFGKI